MASPYLDPHHDDTGIVPVDERYGPGALLTPGSLAILQASFVPADRARAVGAWSGLSGIAAAIGPLVGGWLIDVLSWRWIFFMNAPLAVEGFDVAGAVLAAAGLATVTWALIEAGESGATPAVVASALAGAVALGAFLVVQARSPHPMMPLTIFRSRQFSAVNVVTLAVYAGMQGMFFLLVLQLQQVLGYSALKSAASLLPMVVVMMPLSAVAPLIAKRIGTRTVLAGGLALFAVGLVLLAVMVSAEGGYWSVIPGLLVLSFGIGLCMSPSTTVITESLPVAKQGIASALNDTVRELGGAIGIALLGSFVSAGYRSSVSGATDSLTPELAHRVEEGIGAAYAAGPELGPDAPTVLEAARLALVDGWQVAMWFGVALAGAAFVYLVVRGPRSSDLAAEDALDADLPEFAYAAEG